MEIDEEEGSNDNYVNDNDFLSGLPGVLHNILPSTIRPPHHPPTHPPTPILYISPLAATYLQPNNGVVN